jgi:PmbA protein
MIMEELQQAVEEMAMVARSLGADAFDIAAGEFRSSSISVFKKKVQNTEVSASRGVGIRVFKGNSPGYASTELFSTEAIQQTVQDAMSHCDLTAPLHVELPPMLPALGAPFSKWNDSLESLSLHDMTEFSLQLEEYAYSLDSRINNIPYLGAGRSRSNSILMNSNGFWEERRANSYSAGLGVVAQQGDISKMGVFSQGGRDFSKVNSQELATRAVNRAIEMLDLKPIQGGAYPILLHHRIAGQLLSMFSSSFFAENIQKGQSRLKGLLGQPIACKALQIISDPHNPELPGSRLFDGEGIPTRVQNIVENGVLQSYLYNLESAYKDKAQPAGNASRSYGGSVGCTFHNFIIPPGAHSIQSLRQQGGRCLEIVKLEGGSGCSSVSGEISIGAQGFWVENGERIHAVDGITLSGNFFELLKQIQGIGDDHNDGFSSYKVPSLLVSSMNVSS